MSETKKGNVVSILGLITGAGLLLFWIGFFTVGLAPENPPPCYFVYEHAFPLPDIILALVLIAGAVLSLKGKPHGAKLLIAGGGALAFLGVLDFSFNIQNGMYAISTLDLVLNAFINLWSAVFGVVLAVRAR